MNMAIDWVLVSNIATPTVTLFIGAGINKVTERRANLVTYYGHVSVFNIQGPQNLQVNAHSVIVRNAGGRAARNVRISHNIMPPNVHIWPPVESQTVNMPGGGADIVIPLLVPGEQITISYLYDTRFTFNQINSTVRSDEGFAKVLTILLTPQLPKWKICVLWTLIIMGGITSLYLIAKFSLWLWVR
jgi:hypothetical protein